MPANDADSDEAKYAKITMREPLEVEYWVNTLGVSEPALRAAVGLVGTNAAAVEQHLRLQQADAASNAPTEFGLHVELGVVHATPSGFRGTFKVFAARGAAMALMHADDGQAAASFRSEEEARADASLRAELWILEGASYASGNLDPQAL